MAVRASGYIGSYRVKAEGGTLYVEAGGAPPEASDSHVPLLQVLLFKLY